MNEKISNMDKKVINLEENFSKKTEGILGWGVRGDIINERPAPNWAHQQPIV